MPRVRPRPTAAPLAPPAAAEGPRAPCFLCAYAARPRPPPAHAVGYGRETKSDQRSVSALWLPGPENLHARSFTRTRARARAVTGAPLLLRSKRRARPAATLPGYTGKASRRLLLWPPRTWSPGRRWSSCWRQRSRPRPGPAPLHHTMEQNPPRLPPRPSPWVLPPDSHGSKNKHVLGEDPDTDPWFPQPGLCRGRTAFSGAAWPPPSSASWPELSVTAVPKPGPVQGELL